MCRVYRVVVFASAPKGQTGARFGIWFRELKGRLGMANGRGDAEGTRREGTTGVVGGAAHRGRHVVGLGIWGDFLRLKTINEL